jgi:hypothetical protein
MRHCELCDFDSAVAMTRDVERPVGILRRAWRFVQWLFPAAVLVLIPKCPMCVVADVALLTGMGISMSTGRWLQIGMWAVLAMSVTWLVVRQMRSRKPV